MSTSILNVSTGGPSFPESLLGFAAMIRSGAYDPADATMVADKFASAAARITALEAMLMETSGEIDRLADAIIELNPSNYTHDDVCEANSEAVAVSIALSALKDKIDAACK